MTGGEQPRQGEPMSDYHYLARGQAIVLDLPSPVRRDMPVRHFTLDRIEGRDALLRAAEPVSPVMAGVPAMLTVGRDLSVLESVVVGAIAPNGLAVRLAVSPDRRAHTRVEMELPVELEPLGTPAEARRGLTFNVSMGGAVCRTERPMREDQRAFVVLGDPRDAEVMAIARVVQCRIQATGLYEIRLEFSSLAGEHEARLRSWINAAGSRQPLT
jgi:hypothetical protein